VWIFAYFFCFGALPVPDSGITCGVPDVLSKTLNVPVAGVVSVGVNVTWNLQLFSGASVFSQVDFSANGGVGATSSLKI